MNFVYLSPHFPPNFQAFCYNLKNLGVRVLGIADVPYNQLGDSLKDILTEYYRVDSMEEYDQVYRAVAFFIHKYGRIDGLDSMNEYWLETEARLRTDFNIEGTNLSEIGNIRQKSKMKHKFIHAGLAVAAGQIVQDFPSTLNFIKRVGYPVVAKPDKGVGASNTFKITDRDSLDNFFTHKTNEEYIIEKFIDGNICTFDGLTDAEGNIVFHTSHLYNSVMDLVNHQKNVFMYSLREIPEDLYEAGCRTVKEFKVKKKFFHFEFFRTSEGSLVALEVNMRPPGGYMIDMCNYACDIDLYREWANIITGRSFEADYSRKYHCVFASRRKRDKRYLHTHDDILKKFYNIIVFCNDIPGIMASAMGDYVYIARSENLAELKEMIDFVHQEV